MVNLQRWGYPKLIKKFEDNMMYDCHSLRIRFERSQFQKELFERGQRSLRFIIEHLCQRKPIVAYPLLDEDVVLAWTMLLNRIEIRIDPKKLAHWIFLI